MKTFSKHKFISKEKLAQLFKVHDINLDFNVSDKFIVEREDFVRTGFGQYTILNCDEKYFKILYKDNEHDNRKEILPNKMLKNIFDLKEMSGYIGYSKVKPIYKIMQYDGTPFNCEQSEFYAGAFDATLIGILIK